MTACIRTLISLNGREPPAEAEVFAALGPPPHGSFALATPRFGHHTRVDVDRDADALLGLAQRGFAAVVVARAAWMHADARGLQSPFGSLHRGHHAIVVVGVDRGTLRYYDPYFGIDGQPLTMEVEVFVRDWWVSGAFVV